MENYRPTLDWRCSSSMKKREREKREIASYKSRKSRRIKGIYHYPPPINQPNTSFFTKFPFDFPRISNYPKLIALQFPQLSNSVHLARSIIHSGLKNDQMEKSFRSVPRGWWSGSKGWLFDTRRDERRYHSQCCSPCARQWVSNDNGMTGQALNTCPLNRHLISRIPLLGQVFRYRCPSAARSVGAPPSLWVVSKNFDASTLLWYHSFPSFSVAHSSCNIRPRLSLSLHILSREHFRPVELENLIGIILRYVEAKLGGKRRLEVVLLVEARRVLRDS